MTKNKRCGKKLSRVLERAVIVNLRRQESLNKQKNRLRLDNLYFQRINPMILKEDDFHHTLWTGVTKSKTKDCTKYEKQIIT